MQKEKISKFLGRMFSSKAFYITFSIVASILLWVYVTNIENRDTDMLISDIPVTFVGMDELYEARNLKMAAGDSTISIRVMGKRNTVIKLDKSNITVNVDVSGITTAGKIQKPCYVIFPSDIINTTEVYVLAKDPEYVTLDIEQYVQMNVPVKYVFDGETAEGYMADEMTCSPAEIEVTGPQELVEKIDCAWVELERDELKSTVRATLEYELRDKDGQEISSDKISTNVDTVNVTMRVLKMKEVELKIDFKSGGGASVENVNLSIVPPKLVIAGSESVIDEIDDVYLASIDLADVAGEYAANFDIKLPDGVQNLSGQDSVAVYFTIENLVTKQLYVSNIEFRNAPEGCAVAAITQAMSVLVRGTKEQIESISAENVRVVADLSEFGQKTGNYMLDADIEIDGYPEVGAIGKYKITAVIEAADQ